MQPNDFQRYRHVVGDVPIDALYAEKETGTPQDLLQVSKAGVLPFLKEENESFYYVMRPQTSHPELGPPAFQVAKGTRRIRYAGKWRDVMVRDLPLRDMSRVEDLLMTAIREGKEEIGLRLSNIRRIYWGRPFGFASASTGLEKTMMIFAVEVATRDGFDAPDHFSAKTAERSWLDIASCRREVRHDHLAIIEEMHALLEARRQH